MTNATIHSTPLTSTHTVRCPACGEPVLLVHPDRTEVPRGKPWLKDGDSVPGLWDALSDAQKTPDGFDYELLIGDCPHCRESYYVVTAGFMNASQAEAQAYLYFNVELGAERNALCTTTTTAAAAAAGSTIDAVVASMQWILHEYDTPLGLMQSHEFGPWMLDDPGSISGPYGVSSCGVHGQEPEPWAHARNLLLVLWDSLRALHPGFAQAS